jgi:hypothetical protein
MQETVLPGTHFRHRAFFRAASADGALIVFVEGDGSPWLDDGAQVASDPTAHNPLALQLAIRSPGTVLYLGRPCYLGFSTDAGCTSDIWTDGRYSEQVVASMVAALAAFIRAHDVIRVTLVGYSGGGTLAVLMAGRIAETQRVVTVAANLDIASWSTLHKYLPLKTSLNPVDTPTLSMREIHLSGGRDANVPRSAIDRYLTSRPKAQLREYPRFDHVCCWISGWKNIWSDLGDDVSATR